MNANTTRLRATFAPETRFEVAPSPGVPFRGPLEAELERLKDRLLRRLLRDTPYPEFNPVFRRAANEAAGLAWLTPFPLLVFPELLEEKAHVAVRHGLRQEEVRQRSRESFAIAV